MKWNFLMAFAVLSGTAIAADPAKLDEFADFRVARSAAFRLAEAQGLADAQRVAAYGSCGTCTFREQRGRVWIFAVHVGYGGVAVPDIAVLGPERSGHSNAAHDASSGDWAAAVPAGLPEIAFPMNFGERS